MTRSLPSLRWRDRVYDARESGRQWVRQWAEQTEAVSGSDGSSEDARASSPLDPLRDLPTLARWAQAMFCDSDAKVYPEVALIAHGCLARSQTHENPELVATYEDRADRSAFYNGTHHYVVDSQVVVGVDRQA